ncbi:hypothetical protein K1719_047141 [Acacia pycnantha]|nr:hypothetical protein K1719_047141 [Acacia pycnantha]
MFFSLPQNVLRDTNCFLLLPVYAVSETSSLLVITSKNGCFMQINPKESWLSFDREALVLHNKVRAFAGWPGT